MICKLTLLLAALFLAMVRHQCTFIPKLYRLLMLTLQQVFRSQQRFNCWQQSNHCDISLPPQPVSHFVFLFVLFCCPIHIPKAPLVIFQNLLTSSRPYFNPLFSCYLQPHWNWFLKQDSFSLVPSYNEIHLLLNGLWWIFMPCVLCWQLPSWNLITIYPLKASSRISKKYLQLFSTSCPQKNNCSTQSNQMSVWSFPLLFQICVTVS